MSGNAHANYYGMNLDRHGFDDKKTKTLCIENRSHVSVDAYRASDTFLQLLRFLLSRDNINECFFIDAGISENLNHYQP